MPSQRLRSSSARYDLIHSVSGLGAKDRPIRGICDTAGSRAIKRLQDWLNADEGFISTSIEGGNLRPRYCASVPEVIPPREDTCLGKFGIPDGILRQEQITMARSVKAGLEHSFNPGIRHPWAEEVRHRAYEYVLPKALALRVIKSVFMECRSKPEGVSSGSLFSRPCWWPGAGETVL